MDIYAQRRKRVAEWLKAEGIAAAFFEDDESKRNQALRYLTGQPGDALLVLSADGRSVLIAWDLNMARRLGSADEILAYGDFARLPERALRETLKRLGVPVGAKVELPSTFAYPRYIKFVEAIPDVDLLCREGGLDEFLLSLRAVKDASEIAIYRRASPITDELMDRIEAGVRSGAIATEMDAALLIERECRAMGCEGAGFETIAAGPARSFGIHAFPASGAGAFGGPALGGQALGLAGLSILDFGVRLEGYTTDVTMSFVRGRPSPRQAIMIELVERAYAETVAMCLPGAATRAIAARATSIFAAQGFVMPHSLGHGVGLDAHESPALRDREDNEAVLEAGHIVTIEPGLYDPELGGIRLEDDVLVTEGGHEVLTHSRIVRL
jgi:Xaa-Pro dipeptidase